MPAALPAPVRAGTETYYRERRADFVRRHPGRLPPRYYAVYGDKCLHQFLRAEESLTRDGQAWLRATLHRLQELLEEARAGDPHGFGRLETDDGAFRRLAFATHSRAYLDAGLLALPLPDLWRIVRTPDLRDLLTPDGRRAIVRVLRAVSARDLVAILRRTRQGAAAADPVGPLR